ncbi:hypothetical protein SDC9_182944 [bioreactor metagenome]|uniref:Uncharacterized protein n=1 Tax=bioreactor metagenome TaxID=1076179 RepID=A0A645HA92_9ZZZZ
MSTMSTFEALSLMILFATLVVPSVDKVINGFQGKIITLLAQGDYILL